MITRERVVQARHELQKKSRVDIEEETAVNWAARACAAYSLFVETDDLTWLIDAVEYHHEAVEHAADTPLLAEIVQMLSEERQKAIEE